MSDEKNIKDSKTDKKQLIAEKLVEQQKEARIVRKIVFITSIVGILLIGAIGGGGYYYIKEALKPVDESSKKTVDVNIPIGSSTTGIGQILEDEGIIRDARVFKYYVKFKNEAGFMAGDYKMKPSMTLPEIITSLKTGKVMQEVVMKITIPEGKQLKQIAGIIAEKTQQDEEEIFKQLNDKEFINKMMGKYPDVLTEEILKDNVKYPLEGYLFPATYPFYSEKPTVEEIVTVMLTKTKEVLGEFKGHMEEKELTTHELMTMASLIEEEATEKVDRDKIASVFYNRLEDGMMLQTDPTVLYAHGEHKDRVFYKDLEIDDPYNTYKIQGLPPGPIANPGLMSIEAALAPADTDDMYFLATSTGEVLFSKTLAEHNRKVNEHITNKK
ncbi:MULTISPECIES: endolytic transglycosylase MltG [unclassified Bacillus (in: firmicutes)]|uniref:endolytic transglycosylase MltG n=1 Tax=unclassified Bacillus (in: firmicutes) TaxID=185979 RepID=UPI001BEBBD1C|nr:MULTISPECIES: endolytic transglycosylase MltG [unclassified Bacillus (in: firmicutes)]MBT2636418.1 endolytic transglycosylase MltG [Bacillus sp. ISL-39]MBT2660701.1 endolytic transglycosylase MltG [Bacillus sp. ISL-45]